ncbi:hypothetical protein [Arthrobacter sp. CAU 1506]|nr:hypothetical protein [Arthrobacter sp. CAU 1506]
MPTDSAPVSHELTGSVPLPGGARSGRPAAGTSGAAGKRNPMYRRSKVPY